MHPVGPRFSHDEAMDLFTRFRAHCVAHPMPSGIPGPQIQAAVEQYLHDFVQPDSLAHFTLVYWITTCTAMLPFPDHPDPWESLYPSSVIDKETARVIHEAVQREPFALYPRVAAPSLLDEPS